MLVLAFATFIFSLTVEINQKDYTGESYDSILELYQQDISTINSIIVKEGSFPVNSLSNTYKQLTTLIVPKDSFGGPIDNEKFYNCELLKTVSIDGATSIGRFTFEQCRNLESISIEGCNTIQFGAFLNCIKLSSIISPNVIEIEPRAFEKTGLIEVEFNSVTSLPVHQVSGGYYADVFKDCSSLQKVTMKNITQLPLRIFQYCNQLNYVDTPLVTSIEGSAFEGCSSLANLVFPVLNSIENYAFYKNVGLIEVDLPSINYIGSNAFEECSNLKSFSSENCTIINTYAFNKCTLLETISFPKLVEIHPHAFSYTGLIQVELNSVTAALEYTFGGVGHGDQFRECSKLQKVTMKNLARISLRMFLNCNQLNYVDAPLVTDLGGDSFSGCSSFANLTFPALSSIGNNIFNGNIALIDVNLLSVNSIGSSAFEGCPNLKSFSSENCVFIDTYAFKDCTKLETINFPKLNEIKAYAFSNTGLINVELNSVTSVPESIIGGTGHGDQFRECSKLQKIIMKSVTAISLRMFQRCQQLTYVEAPSCISVSSNGFYQCNNLNELKLDSCKSFGSNSLYECSNIQKVSLGYDSFGSDTFSVLKLTHINLPKALSVSNNVFRGSNTLVSIKLPLVTTIEESTFQNCISLVELEIPKIKELKGDNIFQNCANLITLSLQSLEKVDPASKNLFIECQRLQYIIFPDIPPRTFNKDTFSGLSCKAHVPIESVTTYDNDVSIEGDQINDQKWCGIDLVGYQLVSITADELSGTGPTLIEACISVGLTLSSIKELKISAGQISQEEIKLINTQFDSLTKLTIESSASIEEELIPTNFLKEHKEIQEVTISSSVNVIDESAFEGCSKLTTLICPSAQELRSRCFYGPTLLETLSFESLNTLTGSHFFSNNANLKNLELPKLVSASLSGYVSQESPLLAFISLPETPPTINSGEFLIDSNPELIGVSNSAAIQYDAADKVNNNMKFYSLCLTYVLMTCSIDGKLTGGLDLKSIVQDGAKIVEVIEGTITENDFNLPSSIISFSTREDVIINSIPSNAFSQNTNLKTISILSKNGFTINSEAFSGCNSLESVNIKGASALKGLAFNECTQLKSVVLDDVKELIGNDHFNGCVELSSISLKSLTTVDVSSNRIFFGCSKLSKLSLPSTPPALFNKDIFSGLQDQLTLVLPSENDFATYDNDVRIDGDAENDGLWCGLPLPAAVIYIRFNNRNNIVKGLTISGCISTSGIEESLISTLEITRGILNFGLLRESFDLIPNLKTLIISRSVVYRDDLTSDIFSGCTLESITLPFIQTIPSECFKDCKQLKEIFINDATKICDSAFKGCTNLESISLYINTLEGDSHFEGCTSLTSISLTNLVNVDSSATKIFSDCPLSYIYLPIIPPKTFNINVFSGMNVLILGLSDDELKSYDNNIDVEGDVENDYKWCGIDLIQLYISVSINEKEPVNCPTLAKGVELSLAENVISIEIRQGMIMKSHLDELKNYQYLSKFVVRENAVLQSTVISADQFKDLTSIADIQIMKKVSLMNNCFSGCTSLSSIEFKEVDVICQECFSGCLNLNKIKIPGCKELRGDKIFSGCQKLNEINFLSLEKVDNSASKIFEGCIELTTIKLPSKEPQTFHKDAFSHCAQVTLILPDKEDYFTYDDFSNVVDDKKKDSKWCGINIESFLPQLITYKINDVVFTHRKLIKENQDSSLLLLEDETLELVNGLVDSSNLKSIVKGSSITKLKAQLGTISDIESGTFDGCNSLKEIIIYDDIKIGLNAFQNIPSLKKLQIENQLIIDDNAFKGDIMLEEVSLPSLILIPNGLFADLKNLKKVNLNKALIIENECFKGCISITEISLPNAGIISGDNQFAGCVNLNTIDLSGLTKVDIESSNIFSGCKNLQKIKLGQYPPNKFNNGIFINANIIPSIELPSKDNWNNYLSQCTVDSSNNYLWYGFNTGLTKEKEKGNNESKDKNKTLLIVSGIFNIIFIIAVVVLIIVIVVIRKRIKNDTDELMEV